MRQIALIAICLPSLGWADTFSLTSQVTSVRLYPQGATVMREVAFDIPAGQHELVLLDLPQNTPTETLRVSATGAQMSSISSRSDFVPPRTAEESDAYKAAKAKVERLEEALSNGEAVVKTIQLEVTAAQARVAFLKQIGAADQLAQMDVSALRALTGMIGEETLAALQTAQTAELKVRDADRDLNDLRKELDDARKTLQALVPELKDRDLLTVSVTADQASQGTLTLEYTIWDAAWYPVYDMKLDRATKQLTIERGAYIYQNTGENWQNVDLTLSTVQPSGKSTPSEIYAWLRRIEDPNVYKSLTRSTGAVAELSLDAAAEPAVVQKEVAESSFDGLSVTYDYPSPVNVASGADDLRISLGDGQTSANIFARAVPLFDEQAFLMARITNDLNEILLPGSAFFYLDGRFMAQGNIGLLADGAETDLSFGPIEGLRLARTVLDREQGDTGLLAQSNQLQEDMQIEIENLTTQTWPIELLDRVPFSEQEDLEINWSASPTPSEENIDGKRGVLKWQFDLEAKTTKEIKLSHGMKWPEDQVLR